EAVDHLRTVYFPDRLARVPIDGEEKRGLILIADHENLIVHQHRRGGHSMKVGEGPERKPPALVPSAIVGDETVAGKEDVDVRAIGGGRRRGRIVQLVAFFLAMAGGLLAPEKL